MKKYKMNILSFMIFFFFIVMFGLYYNYSQNKMVSGDMIGTFGNANIQESLSILSQECGNEFFFYKDDSNIKGKYRIINVNCLELLEDEQAIGSLIYSNGEYYLTIFRNTIEIYVLNKTSPEPILLEE